MGLPKPSRDAARRVLYDACAILARRLSMPRGTFDPLINQIMDELYPARTLTRYTNQRIVQLAQNDARPDSKRAKLMTAILGSKTVDEARTKVADVKYSGAQIPFNSIMRWMIRNQYIALK